MKNLPLPTYLLTMDHNHGNPINHGLVLIDDRGYIFKGVKDKDPTPVEDFGMYILQPNDPFPSSKDEQFQMFMAFLAEQEKV